jgi:hypothetical protein
MLPMVRAGVSTLNESNLEETVVEVTLRVHKNGHYTAINASALTMTLADVVCNALAVGRAEAHPSGLAEPPSTEASSPTAESPIELVPGMYLGSKTPYSPAESPDVLEVMPPHCKLVSGRSRAFTT